MLPAAIFEVRIRNEGTKRQAGTIAFSFPGPLDQEAGSHTFRREEVNGVLRGVKISAPLASCLVGAIGTARSASAASWAAILRPGQDFPPGCRRRGFGSLGRGPFRSRSRRGRVRPVPGRRCAPEWNAGGYNWAGASHRFTHMYAHYYQDVNAIAEAIARNHEAFLRRVIAWQRVIYTDGSLPVWFRDSLVNNLHLITETGMWAAGRPPLPGWVQAEDGLFGMNECPRGCPQIRVHPVLLLWQHSGGLFLSPVGAVHAAAVTRVTSSRTARCRGFSAAAPATPPADFANTTRGYQFTTNGISLAAMLDRYYLCYRPSASRNSSNEFYPVLKQNMIWTVNLRPAYPLGDRIIAMPTGNVGTEWFEAPEPGWAGMTAHVGGLHLAQLRITERLPSWPATGFRPPMPRLDQGRRRKSMEEKLWTGELLPELLEPETGRKSRPGLRLPVRRRMDHGLITACPVPCRGPRQTDA